MRAIACLAVFGVHWQQFTGISGSWGPFDLKTFLLNGNTGVCLFFMLSGFLLSLPYWSISFLDENSDNKTFTKNKNLRYALKRAVRIVPAYYLCLTILVVFGKEWQSWNGLRSIILHYLFLHNLTSSTLYDICPPFWTLAVQIQFYIIFPFFMGIILPWIKKGRGLLSVFIACILTYIFHALLAEWASQITPIFRKVYSGRVAEHSALAHLPHFFLGVFTAGFYLTLNDDKKSIVSFSKKISWDLVFFCASTLLVIILSIPDLDQIFKIPHGRYNLPYIPILIFAVIISVPCSRLTQKILSFGPLSWIGTISFGIYVYHWPCMKFISFYLKQLSISPSNAPFFFGLISMIAALIVASGSWFLLEQPLSKVLRRRFKKQSSENKASPSHSLTLPNESQHKLSTTAVWIFVPIFFLATFLYTLIHLPGVPYNVQELFKSDHTIIRIFVFSLLPLWIGFSTSFFGRLLVKQHFLTWTMPIAVILVGQGIWLLLRHSVTFESVNDILGSRIWNWPGNLERRFRLWTLQGPLTTFLIIFSAAFQSINRWPNRKAFLRILQYFLIGLPLVIISAIIIFYLPNTTNIVELVRFKPFFWFGPFFLLSLVALLAANAVWIANSASKHKGQLFLKVTVTIILLVPGWALLYAGLDPAVIKYGSVFPAIRFLLGPDRTFEISWLSLFLRWSIVQLGIVGLLSWAAHISNRLMKSKPQINSVKVDPEQAHIDL